MFMKKNQEKCNCAHNLKFPGSGIVEQFIRDIFFMPKMSADNSVNAFAKSKETDTVVIKQEKTDDNLVRESGSPNVVSPERMTRKYDVTCY